MVELIITEKPKTALRIAQSLADGKPGKKTTKSGSYYELTHNGKQILVGAAVGHLFSLKEKNGKGWTYPVFDVEWLPAYEVDKGSAYTKKYISVLKSVCKEADEFTVATDYDVEGEVIGLNILRHICKQKDGSRMKFSALTKQDIVKAYEKKSATLDWGQANAGETRHILDWYYGINVSRALTTAIKKGGMFKILSSGRVQGPALKIIVDREKEIQAFRPEPFWQLEMKGTVSSSQISAWHEADKFWKKEDAESIFRKLKGVKQAVVQSVEKREVRQNPPAPFDLTTLQTENYRANRTNPRQTLEIAQELYTSGYISYPRTSSQQLPESIGFADIMQQLGKQKIYSELCAVLLKTKLVPNNGKKTDPAHPAIYPTGIAPRKLDARAAKVYDLIVRRFLATFAEPAVRESATVKIDAEREIFVANGIITKEPGWHRYYGPFVGVKEEQLPEIAHGDKVDVDEFLMHDKETQPPNRYNPASIIKELEKRNLGTKATRAQIVDTLFNRGYLTGKAIEATKLGIQTVETLGKHVPKIIDEELTRHFEIEMDEIRDDKKTGKEVLDEARNVITDIMENFKKEEKDIGEELLQATKEAETIENTVGPCPVCREGTLMIKKGKFGKFMACSRYPDCEATFKLPSNGLIRTTNSEVCEQCSYPKIIVIKKGRPPQKICINPECPTKNGDSGFMEKEGHACPRCREGTLSLKRSVYGLFLACNRFPKCRYIEGNKKK
ncbi:DNA topoisomerase I [Candidatus Woesearchaeota archaeon]|nr:DNA topoisomerase I [Candidatus Woesearchaeota archaeon]